MVLSSEAMGPSRASERRKELGPCGRSCLREGRASACDPSSGALLATSDPSSFVRCWARGPSCVKRWIELPCSFLRVARSW